MRRGLPLLSVVPVLAGCAAGRVPDPKPALDAYEAAARAGDADALYGLMTTRSQERLGREGTRRAVSDAKDELRDLAAGAAAKDASRKTEAKIAFDDGDTVTLSLEGGRFTVTRVDGLPPAAASPRQALAALRRALLRAELEPLAGVLTRETREAARRDLSGLLRDLAVPSQLDVRVEGDRALVVTPSGHSVRLRRAQGVWSVEELD